MDSISLIFRSLVSVLLPLIIASALASPTVRSYKNIEQGELGEILGIEESERGPGSIYESVNHWDQMLDLCNQGKLDRAIELITETGQDRTDEYFKGNNEKDKVAINMLKEARKILRGTNCSPWGPLYQGLPYHTAAEFARSERAKTDIDTKF